MLELIGLIGGALVRLFPSVMDFFKEGRDLKYELLRMDKEAALEDKRAANRVSEINAMSAAQIDTGWANGLVEALKSERDKPTVGVPFLDWLNTSVRPILTYWWCIVMYTAGKVVLLLVALQEKTPLKEFYPIIMTEFDRGVVASIIGFWFVDRALRKSVK